MSIFFAPLGGYRIEGSAAGTFGFGGASLGVTALRTLGVAAGGLAMLGFASGPAIEANAGIADGGFSVGGYGYSDAVLVDDGVSHGEFVFSGSGEGYVVGTGVTPELPSTSTGAFAFTGDAEGYARDFGESGGELRLSGISFGAFGTATFNGFGDGEFLLGGDADETPLGPAYGFLVEPPGLMAAYAGIEFEFVTETVALGITEAITPMPSTRERVAFGGQRRALFDGTKSIEDGVVLAESPVWVVFGLVEDLALFNADGTANYGAIGRALERIILSGAASNVPEAYKALLDALVLGAVRDAYHLGQSLDQLLTQSSLDSLYHAFAQALDRLLVAGEAQPTYSLTVLVRDRVLFADEPDHEVDAIAAIRDAVGFAMSLSFDHGEYIAWVMNTESKGMSRYTSYPFNSFGKLGGRYVGCASDGLHWLDADDDNGEAIRARIRTGLDALGSRRVKRIPEAFVGYTSDGTLLLRVIQVNEITGRREAAIYRLPTRPAQNKRENRFQIGRGLKAVDFDFVIENVDGADFDLSSIEFRPIYLDRRTRG